VKCASFGVTDLGAVVFEAPQVERPAKAILKLDLISGGNVIASNEQEIYVFPKIALPVRRGASEHLHRARAPVGRMRAKEHEEPEGKGLFTPQFHPVLRRLGYRIVDGLSQADLAVVSTLDDPCREFVLQGGRVLFLAERDNALQTHIPGLGITPRKDSPWSGDWASSFGWHRFEDVPTGGVVNFAFADLTPEHIIQGFSPRDFALDVYAGLFVGWLHKPVATVARRRAGRGEVLVSTFRLSRNLDTNPLALHLFVELMQLITGK
ncbi:MAG TPA: hypothetical protein VFO91_13420, partial [Anaerolineales bacterium]|nr:hypothetical protein [Anaerolineales bacterium]